MIKGMNHVGISVVDLDRSIRFYRELFDMEVVAQANFEGQRHEAILALPGTTGRAAMLRAENMQVELFEFARPLPRQKDSRYPVSDHGLSHFCIEVIDIDFEYERLRAAGVNFHCPPVDFSGEAKVTYARDPDGNVFELLEFTRASTD